jgi:serine/threonine protein kinase
MSLTPGEEFDRYEILSLLGVGGMGEVYLASDRKLKRKVAIKTLPAAFTLDPDRVLRFEHEARTVSALNHPNIVTILDVGRTDGVHFMAHEYVDGVPLRDRLAAERLPLVDAVDVAIQIAAALTAAHEAGVVHRDIKPENGMLRRDRLVKVLDFGLAKLAESTDAGWLLDQTTLTKVRTGAGAVMGTPQYMSPEQARGLPVDARSDIFSLGVVLYEMVTGAPPFDGVNALDVISEILQKEPTPIGQRVPDAPAELQRVVSKALRKDPDARYQSARELLNDLKDLQSELAFAAKLKSGPSQQAAPPASRSQRGAWLAIAAAIVVVAGLSYALLRVTSFAKASAARFRSVDLMRVTSEGDVDSVTVSPDGKYIAYSLEESGKRGLWTKHLGTGSRVQIVAPIESLAMNASTFSPDGGYVYYTRIDERNPHGELYQVPVLGGTSKRILANVSQPISLSLDGRQIAFGRYHESLTQDDLLIANSDGSGERLLLTVREPDWLSGARAAWSPDGRRLAMGYGKRQMTVAVVSIGGGAVTPLAPERWADVGNVVWFADGASLLFVAREQATSTFQIWQMSYPSGDVRRITNDLASYDPYSLTLTADAGALAVVQGDPKANIWIARDGDASRAHPVTVQRNAMEGGYGLAWMPDGTVIYDSNVNGRGTIWSVNADGGAAKPLIDDPWDNFSSEASTDGRWLTFNSTRSFAEVWRTERDGSDPKQLTRTNGGVATHSVSPDGRWVVYNPYTGGIYKVPIDGGDAIAIVPKGDSRNPQVSPDGSLVAYMFDDEHTRHLKIGVVTFDGGKLVKTFDLPVTSGPSLFDKLFYRGFHWSPDGRALIYINTIGGISNLVRQPLDGGAAKPITTFTSDSIYNFAYAPDAGARARQSHARRRHDHRGEIDAAPALTWRTAWPAAARSQPA